VHACMCVCARARVVFSLITLYMRVYPEVSGLAAWSKICKWYNYLPLDQLYRYFMSQSSAFCCHNPSCCFSRSGGGCWLFHYRLSPEAFGYIIVPAFYWEREYYSFFFLPPGFNTQPWKGSSPIHYQSIRCSIWHEICTLGSCSIFWGNCESIW